MVSQRPLSEMEMKSINGVGEKKLKSYARPFLDIIEEFAMEPSSTLPGSGNDAADKSDSINETLLLIKQKFTLEEIAEERQLTANTIAAHIEKLIHLREVELSDVIDLSEQEVKRVSELLLEQQPTETDSYPLKPVYQLLGGAYSYEVIRCIRANLINEFEADFG